MQTQAIIFANAIPYMHTDFLQLLIFAAGGILFLIITFSISAWLRPHNPSEEKNTNYESGEQPVGPANSLYHARFVIFAIIFVLFEVEVLLLYPLATQMSKQGLRFLVFAEIAMFVLLLLIGLVYAWQHGMLDWEKPANMHANSPSRIPEGIYNELKRNSLSQKK